VIASGTVNLIAATLPPGARVRYREEWLADLAGAAEAGISPWGVVSGALGVAVQIDRENPAVTGMSAQRLAFRRLRVVVAATATALLLLFADFWWAVSAVSVVGSRMLVGAALLAGGIALLALVGVALAAVRARGAAPSSRTLGLALGIGIATMLLILGLVAFLPLSLVMLLPALLAPVVVLAVKDPRTQGQPLRVGARIAIAAPFALAILAIVAGGLLHVYVWNPLERLPGMTLDEIYAGLAAAGELPGPIIPAAWAGLWVLVAIAMLAVALVPPRGIRRFITARRLAGAGLLSMALAAGGVWFVGFGMGMGMADAFMTSGGDAAESGLLLSLIWIGAAISAALVGLLPTRWRAPQPIG